MRSIIPALLVSWMAGSAVHAQEERIIGNFSGLGVRAMGMGGAFVGVADDFTAVVWNPAGLAQIQKREVYLAFNRNGMTNDSRLNTTSASSELKNTRFGSMGFVYPYPAYRGSFVLAAGFNRIKDFDWSLETRGFVDSLQSDSSFRHEGELSMTSIAAAVDISPSISLGLALNITSGEDEATNEFVDTDVDSLDYFLEKRFKDQEQFLDNYQTSYGATLGLLVRSQREDPTLRFGTTISTGRTQEISYTFKAAPADQFSLVEYDDGRIEQAPSVTFRDSYKISVPIELGIGGSYRPRPELLLAASAHVSEWTQVKYQGTDTGNLRSNAAFETQYEDVLRYHLGVEYMVPDIALDLRAGFYADPLPFVGPRDSNRSVHETANPLVVALQDRSYWTVGAGLMVEQVMRIDVAWNRGTFERREGPIVEDVTANRVFIGISYGF